MKFSPQLSAFVLSALGLAACSKPAGKPEGGGGRGGGAVPVVAVAVVQKPMPLELRAIGTVTPSATVSVKPRVGGVITGVNFREGQDVREGDPLFTIDVQPYEAARAQAAATLAQIREQAANAGQQAQRYASLGKSGSIAGEQLDQLQSTARASSSTQKAAEAALQEAEIQLAYCTIRAPLSGRTGRLGVDPGNVVTANSTELVVINQVRPIEAIFALPEQTFSAVQRYQQAGELRVQAATPGSDGHVVEGTLTFIDNTVKAATGTLDVKASFPNEDLALWPGQFADLKLTLTTEPDAIVIPSAAVQVGQNGQYVFVAKDNVVALRPIELARSVGNEAVVRNGLAPGELVVTDGHIRLAPGTKVTVQPAPEIPVPASPATARLP